MRPLQVWTLRAVGEGGAGVCKCSGDGPAPLPATLEVSCFPCCPATATGEPSWARSVRRGQARGSASVWRPRGTADTVQTCVLSRPALASCWLTSHSAASVPITESVGGRLVNPRRGARSRRGVDGALQAGRGVGRAGSGAGCGDHPCGPLLPCFMGLQLIGLQAASLHHG